MEKKIFNRVMIDLETTDTTTTAKVVQIGAVLFNDIGETKEFNCLVSPETQKYATSSEDTLFWWMRQDPAVIGAVWGLKLARDNIKVALVKLNEFITQNCDPSSVMVYCHIDFDLPILNYHYQRNGMEAPWYYKNREDLRDLERNARRVDKSFAPVKKREGLLAHYAPHDCLLQIDTTLQCLKVLEGVGDGGSN